MRHGIQDVAVAALLSEAIQLGTTWWRSKVSVRRFSCSTWTCSFEDARLPVCRG